MIFTNGLFSTTLGAELVTEMMKTFMLDMTVQDAELRLSIINGNAKDPEQGKHELEFFDDFSHATREQILGVNKYRENPVSKMELIYDLLVGDDERYSKYNGGDAQCSVREY